MGQIFNRLNRLIKSELNSGKAQNKYDQALQASFLMGGTLAGTSVGKVGILAGGGGFALGTTSLAMVGGLTGLALYEAIKAFADQDFSCLGGAASGAIAGAGLSSTIGGIGVASGGSAFGVGIAGMTGIGAIAGLGLVGLYKLLQKGITIEQALDLAIDGMEQDLSKFREVVTKAIVAYKRIEQQYNQCESDINLWKKRAELALINNKEYLARQALIRKKSASDTAEILKQQIDTQSKNIEKLKNNLISLQQKVEEAKSQKNLLINKIKIAQANQNLQSQITKTESGSNISAWERMEEKVRQMEAKIQSIDELDNVSLETTFADLEDFNNLDNELEKLKAKLLNNNNYT